jgi:DNA-binding winged helix-turn-helix (wHTH) protein
MLYVFDNYELDPRLYELRCAGTPVPLEPLVFNVLVYLVQHHDRVVTKQDLFEHCWPDQFVGDAAVERCIRAARQAIGDTGKAQRAIRTLHGRGYCFVVPVEHRLPLPAPVPLLPAP